MRAILTGCAVWALGVCSMVACGDDENLQTNATGDGGITASSSGSSSGGLVTDGAVDPVQDASSDAFVDADADADADAAACDLSAYPIAFRPTQAELAATQAAASAFQTANPDATVTVDPTTGAAAAIEGSFPVTLDPGIADACDRAEAAVRAVLTANPELLHAPAGFARKACNYDELFDAEIIRFDGGAYFDDRAMFSQATELLVHVRRTGAITFWRGDYVPTLDRPAVVPCLDDAKLSAAVLRQSLGYTKFDACQLDGEGSIEITEADTRLPLAKGVFVDADGALHFVREVDTLLAADRVGDEEINSDLYCCEPGPLAGCVGKTLIVDELTGEVLAELPRCQTC